MTSPETPRILVIRRRYLGDIVLLGSVFLNLRRHWPAARIGALVERPYAGILPLNPDVDHVHTLPTRWSEWWGFLRQLRRQRYTHVLDFDNTERTAFVTRMSGAAVRVAFDRELIPFRQAWVYTHSARVRNADYDRQPITTTYLALLRAIDVPVVHLAPRLVPRPADVETVRKLVAGAGRKVLVHPGTRSAYRRWPAERFATLCDRIQDELGAQVFVVGGPGERDVAREIRDRCESHVVLLEQPFTTGQFAALLSQFDVMLCHDSGPMHIAAAVGTRVVALFGSQNTAIWQPQGEGHIVLQTDLPCPCLPEPERPGPCAPSDSYHSYCVRRILAPQVFAAVETQLGTPRRPEPSKGGRQ